MFFLKMFPSLLCAVKAAQMETAHRRPTRAMEASLQQVKAVIHFFLGPCAIIEN